MWTPNCDEYMYLEVEYIILYFKVYSTKVYDVTIFPNIQHFHSLNV